MSTKIEFQKKQVIAGLRYHFIKQNEIKWLMIFVNVYAVVTAFLLYYKKIRPELFLLGSVLWILLMLFFWYLLPYYFYRKTKMFHEPWVLHFNQEGGEMESTIGNAAWKWNEVTHFFESPYFVHLYFGQKQFFILPKLDFDINEWNRFYGYITAAR
jgi:hypothetical protein